MAGRILGVDFGERRIGLALGEPASGVVVGLPVLETADALGEAGAIAEIAGAREVAEIVVGLPLNMDDTEGPRAVRTREFADALRERTKIPVRLFDERLTSHEAEVRLRGSGLGRKAKRRHVNTVAAQIIVEAYLEAKRRGAGGGEGSG